MSDASDADACRVIVDPQPASGRWTMAVDEVLLQTAVRGGPSTVRWYRWDRATLSLGYFQAPEEAVHDRRLAGLPVVRRLTGGGAIVHENELTYSCAVPGRHPLAGDVRGLYLVVHERIIQVLAGFGYSPTLRGTGLADRRREFLCFGRGDDFDVVIGDCKVLGSAQRRRKGAVLQHGSLLLRRSARAGAFPGLFDCGGYSVPEQDLLEKLAPAVGGLFGPHHQTGSLSAEEQDRAARLSARET